MSNRSALLFLLFSISAKAFHIPHPVRLPLANTNKSTFSNFITSAASIRGGSTQLSQSFSMMSSWNYMTQSLVSGKTSGLLSLWAIAFSVVFPLTAIRKGYSFSIGYGYSVMAMTWVLMHAYNMPFPSISSLSSSLFQQPAVHLLVATLLYGFRLGTFLLLRMSTVPSKARQMKEYDDNSSGGKATVPRFSLQDWIQRFFLSINVSLFYACMVSPLLYVLHPTKSRVGVMIPVMGAILAWFGLIVETVADTQKFIIKWKHGSHLELSNNTFVGPTQGLFHICRHPNYQGEILFWTGLFVGGITSYQTRIMPWITSSLGLMGILFIMLNATKRLDQKQTDMYTGQDKYDTWRLNVPYPLFPGIKNVALNKAKPTAM